MDMDIDIDMDMDGCMDSLDWLMCFVKFVAAPTG